MENANESVLLHNSMIIPGHLRLRPSGVLIHEEGFGEVGVELVFCALWCYNKHEVIILWVVLR